MLEQQQLFRDSGGETSFQLKRMEEEEEGAKGIFEGATTMMHFQSRLFNPPLSISPIFDSSSFAFRIR